MTFSYNASNVVLSLDMDFVVPKENTVSSHWVYKRLENVFVLILNIIIIIKEIQIDENKVYVQPFTSCTNTKKKIHTLKKLNLMVVLLSINLLML